MSNTLKEMTDQIHNRPWSPFEEGLKRTSLLSQAAAEGVGVERKDHAENLTLFQLSGIEGTYILDARTQHLTHITMEFKEALTEARRLAGNEYAQAQLIADSSWVHEFKEGSALSPPEEREFREFMDDKNLSVAGIAMLTHHSPSQTLTEADVLKAARAEGIEVDRHWKQVGRKSRLTFLSLDGQPGTFAFQRDGSMATHLSMDFYTAANTLHNRIEHGGTTDSREAHIKLIAHSVNHEWKREKAPVRMRPHPDREERPIERSR